MEYRPVSTHELLADQGAASRRKSFLLDKGYLYLHRSLSLPSLMRTGAQLYRKRYTFMLIYLTALMHML
jgi:hypothetical protein